MYIFWKYLYPSHKVRFSIETTLLLDTKNNITNQIIRSCSGSIWFFTWLGAGVFLFRSQFYSFLNPSYFNIHSEGEILLRTAHCGDYNIISREGGVGVGGHPSKGDLPHISTLKFLSQQPTYCGDTSMSFLLPRPGSRYWGSVVIPRHRITLQVRTRNMLTFITVIAASLLLLRRFGLRFAMDTKHFESSRKTTPWLCNLPHYPPY